MDFYTTLFTQIIELNIIIVSLLMSTYLVLIVLVIHNFLLLLERVLMQHNNNNNKNKNKNKTVQRTCLYLVLINKWISTMFINILATIII